MNEAAPAHADPGAGAPLLRDANFLRLWAALACNAFGYEISALAIPLAAAVLLQASVMQMSVLKLMELLPALLFVLPGGALADRVGSKPLLLARACGEALALGLIPLAFVLGRLDMHALCASVFLLAAVSGLFSAAEPCLINAVLTAPRLVDGYSKIQGVAAVAQALAPALAGVLVQWLAAPLAICADALLALAGAALLLGVRQDGPRVPTPAPLHLATRRPLRFAGGAAFIWRTPRLRFIIGQRVLWLMFQQPVAALLLVYAVRICGLGAAATGAAFLACGVGGVAAALLAERLGRDRRVTVRCAACAGLAATALLAMLAAIAGGGAPLPLLAAFLFVFGFANTYLAVHYAAQRGALTPPAWQGRVAAAATICGLVLTGAAVLAAGAASTLLGLPAVLAALACAGAAMAALPLLLATGDADHARAP